jgi:hypothetical protein
MLQITYKSISEETLTDNERNSLIQCGWKQVDIEDKKYPDVYDAEAVTTVKQHLRSTMFGFWEKNIHSIWRLDCKPAVTAKKALWQTYSWDSPPRVQLESDIPLLKRLISRRYYRFYLSIIDIGESEQRKQVGYFLFAVISNTIIPLKYLTGSICLGNYEIRPKTICQLPDVFKYISKRYYTSKESDAIF